MQAIVRCAVDLGLSLRIVENVDRAYRRAALDLHPDKGGETSEFQALLEAKDALKLGLKKPGSPLRKRRRTVSPQKQPHPVERRREYTQSAAWTPPQTDLAQLPLEQLLRLAIEEQQPRPGPSVQCWAPPWLRVRSTQYDFAIWRPGALL